MKEITATFSANSTKCHPLHCPWPKGEGEGGWHSHLFYSKYLRTMYPPPSLPSPHSGLFILQLVVNWTHKWTCQHLNTSGSNGSSVCHILLIKTWSLQNQIISSLYINDCVIVFSHTYATPFLLIGISVLHLSLMTGMPVLICSYDRNFCASFVQMT